MSETIKTDVISQGITEQNVAEFKDIMTKFLHSYGHKEESVSDESWLKDQFRQEFPDMTEDVASAQAKETVEAVAEYDENLKSINESSASGINKEQWMASKIAKAAAGVSVIQHGEYLKSIDDALTNANAQMLRTITTNAGDVSQNINLDGYIAEQYHVNTFNANAALAKSKYFAEVKVPGVGETYGKNSFDIVIRDSTNPNNVAVHQYQVKYGSDAQATIQMLRERGDVTRYSNQQIVVPPDQVEAVRKAFPGKTVVSEVGGTDKVPVKSNSLTKEQAKELQLNAQQDGTVPTTDWNAFKTKELALQIGRNAGMVGLSAAAVTAGFSIVEQLARDGKVDTEETVKLALKTGADAGIKAAITGALKTASETGVIRLIPKGTPVGIIANIVCVSIENIKILRKYASGELTFTQAADQMGRTSTAMVFGLGWGKSGAAIGAAALSWIPVVGPVVGGVVGGMVGYMAGSTFGQAVYEGVKKIGKEIVSVCKAGWEKVKSARHKLRAIFA